MKIRLTGLLCFLMLISEFSFSQDLHFTQFQFAPLTINPALAGSYKGSYRVGGIYRDQYRSVASNAFQTMSIMVDAPVIRGLRKEDWIGIGIGSELFDKAGALGYKRTFYRINAAYHFSLDKKQTSIFTIGVQRNSASVSLHRLDNDNRPQI